MADPDCTGFSAVCARCAGVVRTEEELDEGDETYCDDCARDVDLEYAQGELEVAREEIASLRAELEAANLKIAAMALNVSVAQVTAMRAAAEREPRDGYDGELPPPPEGAIVVDPDGLLDRDEDG